MSIERGNDQELEGQQPLELIPENTNLYEQMARVLPLMGARPDFFLVDKDGEVYLRRKDAAKVSKLSTDYIRQLEQERLDTVAPNGREKFVNLKSLVKYVLFDRQPVGRPRKKKR